MINVLHAFNTYLPPTEYWNYNLISELNNTKNHIAAKVFTDDYPSHIGFEYINQSHSNIELDDKKTAWYKQPVKKVQIQFHKLINESYRKAINQYLKSTKVDLIHAHFADVGMRHLAVAKKHKLPLIVSYYGWDYDLDGIQERGSKIGVKDLFQEASAILVEGNHGKKLLMDKGCPERKIKIIKLGVAKQDIQFQKRIKQAYSLQLVQIASFTEKKGQLYAVKAIEEVLDDYPNLHLTLIGNSRSEEYKQEVVAYIQASGLSENVTIMDFVKYDQLGSEFAKYDVFIHPSCSAKDGDTEGGIPTILFNAGATGMPIISSRHCDIPSLLIDGENGFLAEERKVDQLAKIIEKFYRMSNDDYQRFAKRSYQMVEQEYNVSRNARKLESLYGELLQNSIQMF